MTSTPERLPEYRLPLPSTASGRAIYERSVELIGDTWARAYAEEVCIMVIAAERDAAQPVPALDAKRLARAEHKRALSGGDERCHHSSRSGNDCERIARFLAREYAALGDPA